MEMTSTPLCSMLSSVTIKNSKEALSADTRVINYERVRILHVTPSAFVLAYANRVGVVLCRVTIQYLRVVNLDRESDEICQRTPWVSTPSAVVIDLDQAFGLSVNRRGCGCISAMSSLYKIVRRNVSGK